MNSLSRWFCNSSSSSKNLFVKIVHPGGHIELHDRPVLAKELLNRNPKCCLAYPTVFEQPNGAVVSPDTILILGRKYYVVPLGTVEKLKRRKQYCYAPSLENRNALEKMQGKRKTKASRFQTTRG